jgi:hypothetical protein
VLWDSSKDKDHADLCQQWRVAEAGEAHLWVNVLGLVLLFGTFTAAIMAAKYAKHAAEAAASSARSDRKANKLARRHGERQLRAYSHLDKGMLNLANDQFTVKIVVKNFGQTPANKVRLKLLLNIITDKTAALHAPLKRT